VSGIDGIEGARALAQFLRELAPRLLSQGAVEAAKDLSAVAADQYAAGKGPDDKVWPLRKKDNAIALRRPTSEITWRGGGGRVIATADDVVKHHRGKRPVFPFYAKKLPPAWEKAVEAALRRVAEKAVKAVPR
jgi:hypothetical protein